MEIARRDGLKAALAWRDARFPARKSMSGALGELLGGALASLAHPVESTDGERQGGGANCARWPSRVAAALEAKGVTADEPVLLRMGNRPADLGALLGLWQRRRGRGAARAAAAPATYERLKCRPARVSGRRRPASRCCVAHRRRSGRCCAARR